MAFFSEDFLQMLKERCPIEEVVASYVDLKRSGGNLLGLCPFHREKTPSFTVSPDKQIFHCFGCSTGGNVFSFIMKIENLDFPDAVRFLAKRAGIEAPEDDKADQGERRKRERFFAMHKEAGRYFFSCLNSEQGKEALTYLRKRGLSDKTIRRFGLGYAPPEWDGLLGHLKQKGYYPEEMVECGLCIKGKNGGAYDRFRNRVMFPIINMKGEVVAFGGRVMDNSLPKYLNSPETPIFSKSRNLFAMNLAKEAVKENGVLLAEGYMDVISLHQAGFTNAVASLGTSLTTDHARLILRYTKEVIIAYDSDGAGKNAAKRAIDILKDAGASVRVLSIEGGKDPDEFIKTYGADRFRYLLSGSANYIDFKISRLRENVDFNDLSAKAEFLRGLSGILSEIENEIERELYVRKAAVEYEVSAEVLEGEIKKRRRQRYKSEEKQEQRRTLENLTPKVEGERDRAVRAQQMLIGLLYREPKAFPAAAQQLCADDFTVPVYRALYTLYEQQMVRGSPPDVSTLNERLSEEEMSALTGALAGNGGYEDPGRAASELAATIVEGRLRKLALEDREQDDEKEMVRWYNQIRNKKTE